MNSFEPVICRTNAKSKTFTGATEAGKGLRLRRARVCLDPAKPPSPELHPAWPPSLPADPQIKHNGPRPDTPVHRHAGHRPRIPLRPPSPEPLPRVRLSNVSAPATTDRSVSLRVLAGKAEEAERKLRSGPIIGLFRMPTARSRQLIGLIYCLPHFLQSSCSGSKGSRVFFCSPGLLEPPRRRGYVSGAAEGKLQLPSMLRS